MYKRTLIVIMFIFLSCSASKNKEISNLKQTTKTDVKESTKISREAELLKKRQKKKMKENLGAIVKEYGTKERAEVGNSFIGADFTDRSSFLKNVLGDIYYDGLGTNSEIGIMYPYHRVISSKKIANMHKALNEILSSENLEIYKKIYDSSPWFKEYLTIAYLVGHKLDKSKSYREGLKRELKKSIELHMSADIQDYYEHTNFLEKDFIRNYNYLRAGLGYSFYSGEVLTSGGSYDGDIVRKMLGFYLRRINGGSFQEILKIIDTIAKYFEPSLLSSVDEELRFDIKKEQKIELDKIIVKEKERNSRQNENRRKDNLNDYHYIVELPKTLKDKVKNKKYGMFLGRVFSKDKDFEVRIKSKKYYLLTDDGIVEDEVDQLLSYHAGYHYLQGSGPSSNPTIAIFKKYGMKRIYFAFNKEMNQDLTFHNISTQKNINAKEYFANLQKKSDVESIKQSIFDKNKHNQKSNELTLSKSHIEGQDFSFIRVGFQSILLFENKPIKEFYYLYDEPEDEKYQELAKSFMYNGKQFVVLKKESPYFSSSVFELWEVLADGELELVSPIDKPLFVIFQVC